TTGRRRREYRRHPPPGQGARRRAVVDQRGGRTSGTNQERRGNGSEPRRDSGPPGVDPHESVMTGISPVRWDNDRLILVDQTVLPEREIERGYQSWQDVGAAIRALGAP